MNRVTYALVVALLAILSAQDLSGQQSAVLFLAVAGVLVVGSHRAGILITPAVFVVVPYILGYAMRVLWPEMYPMHRPYVIPQHTMDYAMLWAVRGFSAFAFAYLVAESLGSRAWAFRNSGSSQAGPRVDYATYMFWSTGWIALASKVASIVLFGISLTFIEGRPDGLDSGDGTMQQIFTLLYGLRYPFFLGFTILYLSKGPIEKLRLPFTALLAVSAVEIIAIGSKATTIALLVPFLLALSVVRSRLGAKWLILASLALVIVYGTFAVITEYRAIMQERNRFHEDVFSFSVQAESFGSAVLRSLPLAENEKQRATEVDQSSVLSRFGAGMFSFANLLSFTGRESPFEHAWESFLLPLYAITPRPLVPDKPIFFDSGRNAATYYGWSYGGISVTLLGSLYYAWGYAGIILGMAFFGGLFAFLVNKSLRLGIYAPQWLILMVTLLVPLMDVGMTFQAIGINMVRVSLLLLMLHSLYPAVARDRLSRAWRSAARSRPGSGN